MGFHSLLKESLLNTNLKRIRIKTDPAQVAKNQDFRKIAGYEGFILGECQGKMKILVLDPELTIAGDIPEEMLEMLAQRNDVDVMNEFREYAKECLIKLKGKQNNDPAFAQIDNAATLADAEVFLKQGGFTEAEVNDLYRGFIGND